MKNHILLIIFIPFFSISQNLNSTIIDSNVLNKQIEVLILDYTKNNTGPIFYLTDGKKMIDNGAYARIDSLTLNNIIPKAKYVFVSSIDPNTKVDYRNEFFFCNPNYVRFFEEELILKIERANTANNERYLMGVSFGALNAAYFAAKTDIFNGYALLSPITYPCNSLNQTLAFSEFNNYKIYVSTGKADAEYYVETLYPLLKSKTEKIKFVKTEGGHDFDNWNRQMEQVLNTLLN